MLEVLIIFPVLLQKIIQNHLSYEKTKSNQNNIINKIQTNVRKLITKNVHKHNKYIPFKGETQRPIRRLIPMIQERQVEVQGRAPVVEVERSCKYILVSSSEHTYTEMHSETVIAKLYESRPKASLTQVCRLEMNSMTLVVFTNFIKICYIFFLIKTI